MAFEIRHEDLFPFLYKGRDSDIIELIEKDGVFIKPEEHENPKAPHFYEAVKDWAKAKGIHENKIDWDQFK